MKNILIFNDFSPEAGHATELALLLAGKTNTNLYVWNIYSKPEKPVTRELIAVNENDATTVRIDKNTNWIEKLESKLNWQSGLVPAVHFIEGVSYEANKVLSVTKKYDIGLIVKGITDTDADLAQIEIEALGCSTKSGCPILFIPEKAACKAFEKIVYAADLRFCRHDVVSFLIQIAKPLNASLLIANISAKGLPYMDDKYARSVFETEILNLTRYEPVYFNNIRERDIPKALDVLVNGMNNDLLVLVNNKYHFKELLGQDTPYIVPQNIHIPLLIFPS